MRRAASALLYGWAAVQPRSKARSFAPTKSPVWSLAAEAERPKVERVEIDQAAVILTWQRRQTAGNTWRLELTSHLEGAEKPAFSISIFPHRPTWRRCGRPAARAQFLASAEGRMSAAPHPWPRRQPTSARVTASNLYALRAHARLAPQLVEAFLGDADDLVGPVTKAAEDV